MEGCIIFALCLYVGLSGAISYPEKRVADDLLERIDELSHYGRPAKTLQDKVEVTQALRLVHLHELDTTNQILDFTVWNILSWTDPSLAWDPADYDGVTVVQLPVDKIWTPDVRLVNSVSPVELIHEVPAVVKSSGAVTHVPPYRYRTSCKTEGPDDDTPSCDIYFGPWNSNTDQINFNAAGSGVDLVFYTENHEWTVLSSSVTKHEMADPSCCEGELFGDLTWNIKFKRKASSPKKEKNEL